MSQALNPHYTRFSECQILSLASSNWRPRIDLANSHLEERGLPCPCTISRNHSHLRDYRHVVTEQADPERHREEFLTYSSKGGNRTIPQSKHRWLLQWLGLVIGLQWWGGGSSGAHTHRCPLRRQTCCVGTLRAQFEAWITPIPNADSINARSSLELLQAF